ncbi:hypothetical protein HFX_6178 (plasmid) [Haloferax mediterranei ATCC 33500]|uniref:Uncharacterized protein n=1 Tax=Haloferax mediterranei (strain ATCC 33500 / DSM 1411 / JCM 8866 / NBRC 14739 / NCIMB 2177 / R-4) TaxID=523841 RepID=I3RAP2_HALMT|nr:hypothetical protein HFX_6178 [Haloferax mediterranei ATCC 33500]
MYQPIWDATHPHEIQPGVPKPNGGGLSGFEVNAGAEPHLNGISLVQTHDINTDPRIEPECRFESDICA